MIIIIDIYFLINFVSMAKDNLIKKIMQNTLKDNM